MAKRIIFAPPEADVRWVGQAICRPEVFNGHPDTFYPPRWRPPKNGGPPPPDDVIANTRRAQLVAAAKAICLQCPVMNACRDHADRYGETEGIWGGLTPEERGVTELR